jgi:hypothetical protein
MGFDGLSLKKMRNEGWLSEVEVTIHFFKSASCSASPNTAAKWA